MYELRAPQPPVPGGAAGGGGAGRSPLRGPGLCRQEAGQSGNYFLPATPRCLYSILFIPSLERTPPRSCLGQQHEHEGHDCPHSQPCPCSFSQPLSHSIPRRVPAPCRAESSAWDGRMGFASSCPTPQHVQGRGCTMPRQGSAAGVQIKHTEWTGRVSVAITFVATTARPERSSVARLCLHFLLCCSFPPPQRCVGTRLAQAEKLSCCSTFCVSLSRGTDASCKKYLQARQSCLILQALFKPALR